MHHKLDFIEKKLKEYGCTINNNNGPFNVTKGTRYSGDYTEQCIKRANLTDCILKNAVFDGAAVTGSFFDGCVFVKCSMDRADFEFCTFENCEFCDNPFTNESFNNSIFLETKFINSPFISNTLTGCLFKKGHFVNSHIEHSTLEGAIFEDCIFQDMNLDHLNMEYIEFKNVRMENVTLPFSQIPYIFGGIEYIINTSDNLKINTGENTYISKEEYINEGIRLLCEYFELKECYFPLTNIYLGLGNKTQAYKYLMQGMQQSVITRDFRMLKYFCKLAARNNEFSYKELNKLYTSIQKYMPQDALNKQQLHNYSKHIGEIKTILFSRQNLPQMTFAIKTNIEHDNMQTLSKLLEDIFMIKQKLCSKQHTMQLVLEQNSPFIVTINISDKLYYLCCLATVIIKLISEDSALGVLYSDYIFTHKEKDEYYFNNTVIPLLDIAGSKKQQYIDAETCCNIEEILFNNINYDSNFKLQYIRSNKLPLITER